MTYKFCYFDGKIIELSKARMSPNDLGILRGCGAFDFLRTYNGKPFHLKAHYNRFKDSAKSIGLKVPVTIREVESAIYSLLKKNKVKDGSFRLVITGGEALNGLVPKKPVFYILAEEAYEPTRTEFEKGVKLITHEYMRMNPEAKTTEYLEAVKMQGERIKQKAYEVLYVYKGYIYECSMSNIFLIKGDTLVYPLGGVLKGITGEVVLKLAEKHFKIEERPVAVKEIKEADEIFITGTNKQVLPIVKIDDIVIGKGKVGEKAKLLQKLFKESTNK